MKTFIKTAITALSLTLVAGATLAADGAALLRKVDEIRAPGSNFAVTIKLQHGGASETVAVSVKDKSKGLVQYTAPAKMDGRSILFVDQNMWVYVPGTRRALRISPQQRVLGGVSSADVARTVYSDDYKVVAATPSGGGHVLQLAPKTKAAAYGRIDLTIDGRAAPQKAVFYAGGGRKLKTMAFGGYQRVLGESRPTRLTVVDHVGGGKTTMTYSGFQRTKTPEAWYQPGYLSRL